MTIQIKATGQCFPMVLFIILYKVVLSNVFDSGKKSLRVLKTLS